MLVILVTTIVFLPTLIASMILAQVNLENHWLAEKETRNKVLAQFYIGAVFIAQELAIASVTYSLLGVISFMFTIPTALILRNRNRLWWPLFVLAPFLTILATYIANGQFKTSELGAQLIHIFVLGIVCWGLTHTGWSYPVKFTIALYASSLLHFLWLSTINKLDSKFVLEILLGSAMVILAELQRSYMEIRRHERLAKLQYESVRDDLTGLLNFRAFTQKMNELNKGVTDVEPVLLCALDIDHFNYFNDTYGHLNGNRVLSAFAKTLKREIYKAFDPHCSVYRFGGDEFTIVISGAEKDDVVAVLEKVEDYFASNPVRSYNGAKMGFTFSCGIAKHLPGESYDETLKRADKRIYQVKRSGRGYVLAKGRADA